MLTQPCAEAILLPIKDNQWNEETTFPLDSAVIISVGSAFGSIYLKIMCGVLEPVTTAAAT